MRVRMRMNSGGMWASWMMLAVDALELAAVVEGGFIFPSERTLPPAGSKK